MFLKVLIASTIFLFIAVAGLGIRMLLKNHGRFPETHISRNKEMKERGIKCAQQTDIGCGSTGNYHDCSTCSDRMI